MNEYQPHTEHAVEELGWRAYQPSWSGALLTSFGLGALYGWQAYRRTGDAACFLLAAFVALVFCGFLRWLVPRFRHLAWGDPEKSGRSS